MHRSLALVLGLVASFLAAAGSAQETPATPPLGEEISVSEVLLDARVTDRDGHAIVGLAPDAFRLELDGLPIPLSSATFYSSRRFLGGAEAAARQGIAEVEPTEQRLFVLLFHDPRFVTSPGVSLAGELLDAGRAAAAWIERELAPGDWVAVASYDMKLSLHSDFSRDREQLRRAVEAATTGGEGAAAWPARRPATTGPSLAAGLPAGTALRDATPRIYDALRLLGDATASIRGRKNLVLFSAGFGDRGAFGQYRPDTRFHAPMRDALQRANVAVHCVDLAARAGRSRGSGALEQLAAETGGESLGQLVSFETALARIDRDNQGYYLLAFPLPEGVAPGSYQRVRLTVPDRRLRVTVREGIRIAVP